MAVMSPFARNWSKWEYTHTHTHVWPMRCKGKCTRDFRKYFLPWSKESVVLEKLLFSGFATSLFWTLSLRI